MGLSEERNRHFLTFLWRGEEQFVDVVLFCVAFFLFGLGGFEEFGEVEGYDAHWCDGEAPKRRPRQIHRIQPSHNLRIRQTLPPIKQPLRIQPRIHLHKRIIRLPLLNRRHPPTFRSRCFLYKSEYRLHPKIGRLIINRHKIRNNRRLSILPSRQSQRILLLQYFHQILSHFRIPTGA